MIKEKDLRVGNLVLYDDKLFEVDVIVTFADNDFNPIPLTPEILEKCGFEKVYQSYVLDKFFLYNGPDVAGDWWFKMSEAVGFTVKIKYLHQLQNLYYALTGEELKINM